MSRRTSAYLRDRTPQWAEAITSVPARTIERLARELATTRPACVDAWSEPGQHSNGVQVAFNAGDSHCKLRRGFSVQDGWVIDNNCGTPTRLTEVNLGGSGCKPVPLEHRVEGDEVVLAERDLLAGWRYFR
jgi:hypothetical protein